MFICGTAAKLPEFVSGLRPVTAVQGRTAKFEVEVDGHPAPEITWSVNHCLITLHCILPEV